MKQPVEYVATLDKNQMIQGLENVIKKVGDLNNNLKGVEATTQALAFGFRALSVRLLSLAGIRASFHFLEEARHKFLDAKTSVELFKLSLDKMGQGEHTQGLIETIKSIASVSKTSFTDMLDSVKAVSNKVDTGLIPSLVIVADNMRALGRGNHGDIAQSIVDWTQGYYLMVHNLGKEIRVKTAVTQLGLNSEQALQLINNIKREGQTQQQVLAQVITELNKFTHGASVGEFMVNPIENMINKKMVELKKKIGEIYQGMIVQILEFKMAFLQTFSVVIKFVSQHIIGIKGIILATAGWWLWQKMMNTQLALTTIAAANAGGAMAGLTTAIAGTTAALRTFIATTGPIAAAWFAVGWGFASMMEHGFLEGLKHMFLSVLETIMGMVTIFHSIMPGIAKKMDNPIINSKYSSPDKGNNKFLDDVNNIGRFNAVDTNSNKYKSDTTSLFSQKQWDKVNEPKFMAEGILDAIKQFLQGIVDKTNAKKLAELEKLLAGFDAINKKNMLVVESKIGSPISNLQEEANNVFSNSTTAKVFNIRIGQMNGINNNTNHISNLKDGVGYVKDSAKVLLKDLVGVLNDLQLNITT